MIKYIKGDATLPQGPGDKILIHISNCNAGWGAGFTGAINRRWPENIGREYYAKSAPEWLFRKSYSCGQGELGNVQFCPMPTEDCSNLWVVNMVCQDGYKSSENPVPLDYYYLSLCLGKVNYFLANLVDAGLARPSVHCPKIGSGLAGGDWERISNLLEAILVGTDITVYEL